MNYLLITLLHLASLNPITQPLNLIETLSHDIILVQGEAKLVTMTPTGEIIQSYDISEDYFSSTDSHEELVDRAVAKTAELINTRFITVDYDDDGLSEDAVEHIRYISVLAEQSAESTIQITLSDSDYAQGITGDITDILVGFGIDRSRIEITSKTYLGIDESQFIKITVAPNKNS